MLGLISVPDVKINNYRKEKYPPSDKSEDSNRENRIHGMHPTRAGKELLTSEGNRGHGNRDLSST